MGSNLAEQEFPVGCLASLVTFLAMHGLDIEDMVVIDLFYAIHQYTNVAPQPLFYKSPIRLVKGLQSHHAEMQLMYTKISLFADDM